MQVTIDQRTGKPKLDFEEEDISEARQVVDMMGTNGWKTFEKYIQIIREKYIDKAKVASVKKNAEEPCSRLILKLSGIDDLMIEMYKMKETLKSYYENKKEEADGNSREDEL